MTRYSPAPSRRTAIGMLSSAALYPADGLAAKARRKVSYALPLIAQTSSQSCWAAAIAMIVAWSTGKKLTPLEVATKSNRVDQYKSGILPLDSDFFSTWGMMTEAPQTYTADGFMDLLERYGPIWIAARVAAAHVRVVTAFDFGSGDPYDGLVTINDPLDQGATKFNDNNLGSRYQETYTKLALENESLGATDLDVPSLNDPSTYPVYFAHLRKKPHN